MPYSDHSCPKATNPGPQFLPLTNSSLASPALLGLCTQMAPKRSSLCER